MSDSDTPSPPRPRDLLLRGILPERGIRVVAAVTTALSREATRRHGAIGVAAAVLGRAATAGALLATLTKDRERLTAELNGGGPIGKVIIDASANGDVRVTARNAAIAIPALPRSHVPLAPVIGSEGFVRVARDLGLRETVNGQTTLAGGELDTDLEHYLTVSEQVPSLLACEALLGAQLDVEISAGVLFQTLPGSEALPWLDELRERLRGGQLTRLLSASLDEGQPPLDPTAVVEAILGDAADEWLPLDERTLRFFCPCSHERAVATLTLLSLEDLAEMVAEGRGAEVTCEFCRAEHKITPTELERVRTTARATRPS